MLNKLKTTISLYFTYACLANLIYLSSIGYTDELSIGKKYSLTPLPNYKYYPANIWQTLITDGKKTKDIMWLSPNGLAWKSGRIKYIVDLEKSVGIKSIILHSAAAKKGSVSFPTHIFAYLSNDNVNYTFVGDLVNNNVLQVDNYQARDFELNNVATKARFLRLDILGSLPFFVMDEVQVLGDVKVGNQYKSIKNIVNVEGDIYRRIKKDADELYLNKYAERIGYNKRPINEDDLLKWRLLRVNKKSPSNAIIVERVSTWGESSPFEMAMSHINTINLESYMNVGMCDYHSFKITNTTNQLQKFLMVSSLSNKHIVSSSLWESAVVKDINGNAIFDPLIKLTNNVTLNKGESKFILVKACPMKVGETLFSLKIKNDSALYAHISNKIIVGKLGLGGSFGATTWSYLNKKFMSISDVALQDLVAHHESAIVVPLRWLDAFPKFRVESFEKYISIYDAELKLGNFSKIILFLGLTELDGRLTTEKKENFLQWYEDAVSLLKKHGWQEQQIYIYPYDEPRNSAVNNAREFFEFIKKNKPSSNTFVTIDNESSMQLIEDVDLACVIAGLLNKTNINNHKKTEIWTYATQGPAKNNNIYSYYRLISWTAIKYGLSGVGFWSYSDFGRVDELAGWSDYAGANSINYSPVYFYENKLVSSRRWEAWRQGIEDASLLQRYRIVAGSEAMMKKVEQVLSRPDDTWLADQVRQDMLRFLIGHKAD